MTRSTRIARVVALAAAVCALASATGRAASLQPVKDWGASGVPSTVSMYIYVPDRLAAKAPVLVCSHYCGGSAAAVFAEASGGGLVKAADEHGFIMVFPQAANADGSGRCWDVGSTRSLTHDGGGDTTAIAQMVRYTIAKYDANADRVYATGISSGAMMTEALLAVYPDIFKAGVEFCGVPAGCWAVGASPDGTWSGPCAGGKVTHTGAEWGAIARQMYPGFTGHRPRISLWHGDADSTINFQNQLEAIKQWTDVLGLATAPTSSASVVIGAHQWTRESWKDACGYTVLEAWNEHGGEHNVDVANLNAQYSIPFLGLDQTGPTDPEVAQCGSAQADAGSPGEPDAGGGGDGDGGSKGGGGGGGGGTGGTGGGGGSAGGMGGGGGAGGGGGGDGGGEAVAGGGGDVGLRPVEGSSGCGTLGGPAGAELRGEFLAVGLALAFRARKRRAA